MSIVGNGYPAYHNGVKGVDLNFSTVQADRPETDVLVNVSDIDGFRDTDVRGQRWTIEVQVNLFKYADYGVALLAQLSEDLGNKHITLWRHINGEPMSGTWTLAEVSPFYLNNSRHKDRVKLVFASNDYVYVDGGNYTLEYINSIDIDTYYVGMVPTKVAISGRFVAVTWANSTNGRTALWNIGDVSPLIDPTFIDDWTASDVLSPTVTFPTNYPLGLMIEDRARSALHISYWAKGLYVLPFDNSGIYANTDFYDMDNAHNPIWNHSKGQIYLSQRTKVMSILERNGEDYNLIHNANGGGGGTSVYIDAIKDGSLIAVTTTDATGHLYIHRWDGTTFYNQQSDITHNFREVAFDNRGYLWVQRSNSNDCHIYKYNSDGTGITFVRTTNPYGAQSWISNIDNYIWLGDPNNNRIRQFSAEEYPISRVVNHQEITTQYDIAGQAVSSGGIVAIPTNNAGSYFIELYKKVRN